MWQKKWKKQAEGNIYAFNTKESVENDHVGGGLGENDHEKFKASRMETRKN